MRRNLLVGDSSGMATADPKPPADTAGLSLLEMRRHLLRRAGTLGAQAQDLRRHGAQRAAARVATESDRLLSLARRMGKKERS